MGEVARDIADFAGDLADSIADFLAGMGMRVRSLHRGHGHPQLPPLLLRSRCCVI